MEDTDFPDIALTYFNTEENGRAIFGHLYEDFSISYRLSMKDEFRHIQTLTTIAKFYKLSITESCVWACKFFCHVYLPVKNTRGSVIQKYKKMQVLLLKLRHLTSKDSTILVQKNIVKRLKKNVFGHKHGQTL